jgi:hypothetical protein
MSHTIKTLGDGAITRKALAILHNKLVFVKSINKEYDSRFAQSGAKIGANLLIREPNQFTVRSGAVMDSQDITESTQTLTLATQRGVDINFSSVELALSMDDFAERILDPAMSRLAAEIDKIVIAASYKDVYNMVYTTYGTAPAFADIQSARAKLSKGLAPAGSRNMLMESLSMNSAVNSMKALFQSAPAISRQYNTGLMGHALGFDFLESEMVPTHTNGTRDDTTPVCNTSTGITSGSASITTTGADGAMKAGDIFTIADVYAVNPETKERYAHLQQFVITADHTNDATDVWSVSPAPVTSGAKQNVSLVSAGASKAIVNVAAGGSGTASAVDVQNLAYHKDAFTFVTADLELPRDAHFAAREVFDGISMRVWRASDIVNDKFPCRIDVLFGYKTTHPDWACRLPG